MSENFRFPPANRVSGVVRHHPVVVDYTPSRQSGTEADKPTRRPYSMSERTSAGRKSTPLVLHYQVGNTSTVLIRRERPEDVDVIAAVHEAAFAPFADGGSPGEPGLVAALRVSNDWIPALSLVAEGDDGTVVGHVCVTRGRINGRPALALGPIGVLPDLQRHGVGSALMHAVIGAADALGESIVVLLGHTDYYPKFGFVPAEECGISPDVEEWAGPHFQARRLTAYNPAMRGVFRYPQAFYDLS